MVTRLSKEEKDLIRGQLAYRYMAFVVDLSKEKGRLEEGTGAPCVPVTARGFFRKEGRSHAYRVMDSLLGEQRAAFVSEQVLDQLLDSVPSYLRANLRYNRPFCEALAVFFPSSDEALGPSPFEQRG